MLLQISIFMILLASSGGTPYYITPSDDIIAGNNTCFFEGQSLQPCSTLETLAAEGTLGFFNDFGENVTVFFFPGRHVTRNDTDLIFASFKSVILTPLDENGSEILIECKAKMTISFLFVDMIIIRSFKFHSCGRQDILMTRSVIRIKGDMTVAIKILNSSFISSIGSAVTVTGNTVELEIDRSQFKFIQNATACGAICATSRDGDSPFKSNVSISDSIFENNLVRALSLDSGIQILHRSSSIINIENSSFMNNTSVRGAAIDITNMFLASTSLIHSTFDSNRAVTDDGGAIHIHVISNHSFIIADCTFQNNRAARDGGAIKMLISGRSHAVITNSLFLANICDHAGGGISFYFPDRDRVQNLTLRSVTLEENSAQSGGGLSANANYLQVIILDKVILRHNYAVNGGAISIERVVIDTYRYVMLVRNKAKSAGGGLLASESNIFLKGKIVSFRNNSAKERGGAIFLSKSFFSVDKGTLSFISNQALFGGALFIENSINWCKGNNYYPCFFRNAEHEDYYFHDNKADKGPVLYGGFLNTCNLGSGIRQFSTLLSTHDPENYITSDVMNVCFCDNEQNIDCSMRYVNLSAIRGESISLKVTTIDQFRQFKPSFVGNCDDSTLVFGEGECNHYLSNACQSIKFHVYSREVFGDVILRSGGPCKEINKLTVTATFLQCPRCFQLAPGKDRCECDRRLGLDVQCHIDDNVTTVKKQGRSWFQYHDDMLQVCKHCPLGYCKSNVIFQPLADVNESQCDNNRSGIVCGACKDSFSVALGSSRCIDCSSYKYNILWLIPLFAVMGLILVLSMLLLELTISIGLINGLIFYANVLSISIFINTNNCFMTSISVFISWVNLDFGIEKCFYSELNIYQKTWLQFVFPLYIWLLVGLIIIFSHYSTRVMKFLGRKVIPVLATLFLLSYAKMLKTIITVFDFIEVLTGDADNISDKLVPRKVWSHDGNVNYLSGEHIPLFIVALLFLVILFLPYTLLLTFGQCLRSLPRRKGLKWLHSTAFVSIIDAYHAPYNRKHRYWTGALLFIRCILLIAFVSSYKVNSLISNTFATAIVTIILLVFKASIKNGIYRSSLANIFENIFLLNLGVLASTVYYLEGVNSPKPKVCACITASISVALVTFLAIIACHIYYKMKGFGCNKLKRFFSGIRKSKPSVNEIPLETTPTTSVTTSFVELRESLLESTEFKM